MMSEALGLDEAYIKTAHPDIQFLVLTIYEDKDRASLPFRRLITQTCDIAAG